MNSTVIDLILASDTVTIDVDTQEVVFDAITVKGVLEIEGRIKVESGR